MNKAQLQKKYKDLIHKNEDRFIEEVSFFKDNIKLKNLTEEPILVYSQNKRNSLYYTLCMYYSLKRERILDFAVITGQTLINQHFLSEENRDMKLYDAIYYADIAFISLSQFDYTGEYLESLIIELIESRKVRNKLTIVSYDVLGSGTLNYVTVNKKLHTYFMSSDFDIIDLANKKSSTSSVNKTEKKKGRII